MSVMTAPSFVAPLVVRPPRFGLLSVADVVDDADPHWRFGGVIADGDACTAPSYTQGPCAPTAEDKDIIDTYQWFESPPFGVYVLNGCKTVGRLDDASERARRALERGESFAVERGVQDLVFVPNAEAVGTEAVPIAVGVGMLEDLAAATYGGQITLHMPRSVVTIGGDNLGVHREGDHLETLLGSLVSAGAYAPETGPEGETDAPDGQAWIWATGQVRLVRGPIFAAPTTINTQTNDFLALAERMYAPLVDCFVAAVLVQLTDVGVAP